MRRDQYLLMNGLRVGAQVLLFATVVLACNPVFLPPRPDPELLRCFRLETDLPASYADSLGYEIPPVIRLVYLEVDQWMVLPTDFEYHPSWTVYDRLESSRIRRAREIHYAPIMKKDSIDRIPGDSIDISFPSALGRLVFRLGRDGDGLRGRAEWVVGRPFFFNEGKTVMATPTSCSALPKALKRTPDGDLPGRPRGRSLFSVRVN